MNHRLSCPRLVLAALASAALLSLTGCPPASVNPIAPPDATVQNADFEGTWIAQVENGADPVKTNTNPVTIKPTRGRDYLLTQKDAAGAEKEIAARLIKAGNAVFIEFRRPDDHNPHDDKNYGFCRVEITPTTTRFLDWDESAGGKFETQPGIDTTDSTNPDAASLPDLDPNAKLRIDMVPKDLHQFLTANAKSFSKPLQTWKKQGK